VRTADDCRSGQSTEKGEQGLMCRSCRCGRTGAGADWPEMQAAGELEQRSSKRRWGAATAAKISRLRLFFSSPFPSLSVNLPAPAVNASEREIYCALRSIPVDWRECGVDFPPSAPTGARFPAHSYWRPLAGCRRPPDAIRA